MVERMLVIVFEDKSTADGGYISLSELDSEGAISLYAEAVIRKNSDGTATIEESQNVFPMGTISGTAIGAMLGLLGGSDYPSDEAVSGAVAGSILDLDRAGVNVDFLIDASGRLKPGKWAVVADISEEAVTPVDSSMKALGGIVFRATRQNVEDQQEARDEAALKNDIKELEKEEKQEAREEKKAELKVKIQSMNDRLRAKIEQSKERSEQRKQEMEAKVHSLEEKAKKSRTDIKAKIEARVHDMRKDTDSSANVQTVQNM
jgi:uncharacterized membrane protein